MRGTFGRIDTACGGPRVPRSNDFVDRGEGAAEGANPTCTAHPEPGDCLAAYRGDITRNGSWLGSLLLGVLFAFGLLGYMIHNDGLWPKDQGWRWVNSRWRRSV